MLSFNVFAGWMAKSEMINVTAQRKKSKIIIHTRVILRHGTHFHKRSPQKKNPRHFCACGFAKVPMIMNMLKNIWAISIPTSTTFESTRNSSIHSRSHVEAGKEPHALLLIAVIACLQASAFNSYEKSSSSVLSKHSGFRLRLNV